jgi:hypothetical protein
MDVVALAVTVNAAGLVVLVLWLADVSALPRRADRVFRWFGL